MLTTSFIYTFCTRSSPGHFQEQKLTKETPMTSRHNPTIMSSINDSLEATDAAVSSLKQEKVFRTRLQLWRDGNIVGHCVVRLESEKFSRSVGGFDSAFSSPVHFQAVLPNLLIIFLWCLKFTNRIMVSKCWRKSKHRTLMSADFPVSYQTIIFIKLNSK